MPAHSLPFAIAFKERTVVQVIRDLGFVFFLGRAHQPKCDNGGCPILLDPNVFGPVSSRFLGGLAGFSAHLPHDIRFSDSALRRARVNEIVCPKPVMHGDLVA